VKNLYQLYKKLGIEVAKLNTLNKQTGNIEWLVQKNRENIDKITIAIEKLREEREKSSRLEAIYFPYSRILDPYSLRKSIFLFDKIWLLDALDKEMRNVVLEYKVGDRSYLPYQRLTDAWKKIQDDYYLLSEANQIEFYDTSEISKDFEALIGKQFLKDIEDAPPKKKLRWKINFICIQLFTIGLG
jgi:hypothetical protein